MPKITKRVVDGLEPDQSGKDRFVWDTGDGALKGFGIRIKPTGTAAYFVQYRNKEARTRRLVVGRIGVITPEEARDLAKEKLREVTRGGDPSGERHAARKGLTVAELCDLYLVEAKAWVKPTTLAVDKSRIDAHVKPLLGRRTVAGLKRADLEKFQADIAAGKTAKARPEKGQTGKVSGGRAVAARTLGMLGSILEFAKRHGIIIENPARGVRKFSGNKNQRFLSFDEIMVLGKALRESEAEGENKIALAAIRALLLTGCRRNEILSLPWEWLDAKAQCIRFGDTKEGAQLRPLGKAAAKFLESQPRKNECKWIFPSAFDEEKHFVGLPHVLERVCRRANLKNVSLHVLRHTYAAAAAEMGFSELTIAGLIGHKIPGVTARYAHVPDSALVSAADRVSARILAALEGEVYGEVIELSAIHRVNAK